VDDLSSRNWKRDNDVRDMRAEHAKAFFPDTVTYLSSGIK
jgi:hypothetical protein